MPAILDPDDYERWFDPGITHREVILDCLKPFAATLMSKYPVTPRAIVLSTTMRSVREQYQWRTRRRGCSDFIEQESDSFSPDCSYAVVCPWPQMVGVSCR